MTKKASEKNKTWEKERRDRLNRAFEELAKLLPQYDPTVTWSKNEIIQKSITYIQDIQNKYEKLLEDHDPKVLDDYKQLLDTLKFFRTRNNQLADLLNKAKITIPPAKFPKFITDKAHILEEPVTDFKPRSAGRPKKYSSLENDASNKKPKIKEPLKDKPESSNVLAETVDPTLPGNEGKPKQLLQENSDSTAVSKPVESTIANVSGTNIRNELSTANAIITTGVLIPVVACKPTVIIPPTNGSSLVPPSLAVNSESSTQEPKCKILSIETLPRLGKVPKKGSKSKPDKVNFSPYPILKLYVRRPDNKVPIPALKRDVVTVKKKCRKRPNTKTKDNDGKNFKKRRKSVAQSITKSPNKKRSTIGRKTQNVENNPEFKKDDDLLNSLNEGPTKCIRLDSLETNETTLKTNNSLSLPDNVLPDDYFSALDIPDTNPNSTSVSPTAAFLLSFPVVNPSIGGKVVGEADGEVEGNTHERSDSNNLNEGLENLNNFFSTKEYFKYCNQTCGENGKLAKHSSTEVCPSSGLPSAKNETSGKDIATMKMIAKSKTNCSNSTDLNSRAGMGENTARKTENSPMPGKNILFSTIGYEPVANPTLNNPLSKTISTERYSMNSATEVHPSVALATTSISGKPSSSFSVSNIFQNVVSTAATTNPQTNTAITVAEIYSHTLPKPQHSVTPFPLLKETTKTVGIFADVETLPISNIGPWYSKPSSTLRSKNTSNFSMINPIPNPIPVALPQPSNFPAAYRPQVSSGIPSSSVALQTNPSRLINTSSTQKESLSTMSISKSNFDVKAMLPHFPENVGTKKSENLNFSDEGKNILSSSVGNTQTIDSSKLSVPNSNKPIFLDSFIATSKTQSLLKSGIPNLTDAKSINKNASTPQTLLTPSSSKAASASNNHSVINTGNEILPIGAQPFISTSTVNTASTNQTSNKKICTKPTQSDKTANTSKVAASSKKPNTAFEKELQSKLKLSCEPSIKYPSMPVNCCPPTSNEFTFNLTTGTTAYSRTSGVTCLPEPSFVYSSVNQNLQWLPCTLNSEFQTPFTFSLTSTTATPSTMRQSTNPNSSALKPDIPITDNYQKKSVETTASKNSFNTLTDHSIPSSYPPSNLSFPPQFSNNNNTYSYSEMIVPTTNYSATNFTFSLAKQQVTTTTVSSELMKTLPSSNTIDQKYQPLYNTYGYDNYPQMYSSDTTNFTFALTNPTQTSTCSKVANSKNPQRFSGSFSIDATLGVTAPNPPQPLQHTTTPQSVASKAEPQALLHPKGNPAIKINNMQSMQGSPIAPVLHSQNQNKSSKSYQKSHVNWMTSSNTAESVNPYQQNSYYQPYGTSTSADITNKNNPLMYSSTEDNFPSWSPSKVLDTSHLLQSAPSNNYYDFNTTSIVGNSVVSKDLAKQVPKPNEMAEKCDKALTKATNKNSQSRFFSVSHLVDENIPNASRSNENNAKKPTKIKDVRKNLNSSLDSVNPSISSYETPKPIALVNSYSAEALISKKDNRNQPGPASIHHLHNSDLYPIQNDSVNNSYYQSQDTAENINYNSNYFYNFIPSNQNYIQDIDYLGSFQDTPTKKLDSSYTRKTLPVPDSFKNVDKKPQPSTTFISNRGFDSNHHISMPSMPPSNVPSLDPFETFQYSNNFPNSGWNGSKNMTGNFPTVPHQGVLPYGDDVNMQVCNQAATGNSGSSNITNFNLSTICPEISGKGNNPGTNNW